MSAPADEPPQDRTDYSAMMQFAIGLHEQGLAPRDVLRRCYGVDFPEEFYAVIEAGPDLLDWGGERTDFPWQLLFPPERGGPAGEPFLARIERTIHEHNPDLVPLIDLNGPRTRYGGKVVCYQLSHLAADRPDVVVVDPNPPVDVVGRGDSFLGLLREHYADRIDDMHQALTDPRNARAPLVEPDDMDEAASYLRRVEELIERSIDAQ